MAARLAPLAPLRLGLRFALGRFATKPLLAALTGAIGELPAATMERRLGEILTIDVTGQLHRLTIPVLSLHASHDRLIRSHLLNSIELEGPHFLLQHAPERAARILESWIAGHFPL